ncbi:MAG TPA: hypothetical protein VJR89_30075, partial [Polyangiales bacterium]|nr:hypothetical protein [Polyangiales bacterium]
MSVTLFVCLLHARVGAQSGFSGTQLSCDGIGTSIDAVHSNRSANQLRISSLRALEGVLAQLTSVCALPNAPAGCDELARLAGQRQQALDLVKNSTSAA